MNKEDIKVHDIFNELEVLSTTPIRAKYGNRIAYKLRCLCLACNRKCMIRPSDLILNKMKSCGCRRPGGKSYISTLCLSAALSSKLAKYKSSAAKRNYSWEISDEVANRLMQAPCYYCGIIQVTGKRAKVTSYDKFDLNGIDRIINSQPYTEINSVSCCKSCNRNKGAKSIEDFIGDMERVYNYLNLGQPKTLLEFANKVTINNTPICI